MLQHLTPPEALETLSRHAVSKSHMPIQKLFASSVMAAILLSMGCASLLVANASPDYAQYAPGFLRLINAAIFPYGLALVLISGTSLTTASMMDTAVAFCQGRLRLKAVCYTLAVTLVGNLVGSLLMVVVVFGLGGTFNGEVYRRSVISYATSKQLEPSWGQILIRSVGANFLLSFAEFQGSMGRSYTERLAGIWLPAAGFITLEFDHLVANMIFIPLAMWHKAPGITVGLYLWKGILPVALGNFIGGALFVGVYFWYIKLQDSEPVPIDGKFFEGEERSNSRTPILGGYSDHEQGP